jgi:PE family
MSSYLAAAPDVIAAAATDVASISSALAETHAAATAQTFTLVPAAADEVSAATAKLFSSYAHEFQAVSAQASAFHEQFVQHLKASAGLYAGIEAGNAASLKPLPPEEPNQLISRLAPSARLRLDRLGDTLSRLEQLPLPGPLVNGLEGTFVISTFPYLLALAFIVLASEGGWSRLARQHHPSKRGIVTWRVKGMPDPFDEPADSLQ